MSTNVDSSDLPSSPVNKQDETSTVDSKTLNESSNTQSFIDKERAQLKQGQQQAGNIISKTRNMLKERCDLVCRSLVVVQRKAVQMVPKSVNNAVYWRNPVQSGIIFALSLGMIITFMLLSSLAAISFWLLTFLAVVGLYKLYNYILATFVGTGREDIFNSTFPTAANFSKQQADDLANKIHIHGTNLLTQARHLFLWENLTNSILFGLVLFMCFYIGLSLNTLTLALTALIFVFTVPKIYEVYQVPIDRAASKAVDQVNQIMAQIKEKLPNKAKKA